MSQAAGRVFDLQSTVPCPLGLVEEQASCGSRHIPGLSMDFLGCKSSSLSSNRGAEGVEATL